MGSTEEYRILMTLWRDATDEYEAAVEALLELADARGQGDRSLPLIVREGDVELAAAVERELEAGKAVAAAHRRLSTLRLSAGGGRVDG